MMQAALRIGFSLLISPLSPNPLNIVRAPIRDKTFYLTFDAHNDSRNVAYILDTLRKHKVRATFFLTGRFIKNFPLLVRRIAGDGHVVGNHTLTHQQYVTADALRRQLLETERLYTQATGRTMTRVWRAPYLQHLKKLWELVEMRKIGYQHIDVSLCAVDWFDRGHPAYVANETFLRAFRTKMDFSRRQRIFINGRSLPRLLGERASYRGVIMLIHAGKFRGGKRDFVFVLEPLIIHLKKNGYRFATCDRFVLPSDPA